MSLKAYLNRKGMGKHDSSVGAMSSSTKPIVGHSKYHEESMRKKVKNTVSDIKSL